MRDVTAAGAATTDPAAEDPLAHAAAEARRMWAMYEPVHVVTYFHPAARAAFEQAGLRGFWRGYFASRTAPLGPVGAPPVIAAFFNFAPQMATRALPAVWELITPAEALRARSAGAVAALRQVLGLADAAAVPTAICDTADVLCAVIDGLDGAGRPLGAPNAALPLPAEPLARLWHAATVLREHRGDGHVAALVAAGFDGCEALVLRTAADLAARCDPAGPAASLALTSPSSPRDQIQPLRGWTDEEWEQAATRLANRGLTDEDGVATAAGRAAHRAVEEATDLAAARPWVRIGPTAAQQLATALRPVARAAMTAVPTPNPGGLPAPGPQ